MTDKISTESKPWYEKYEKVVPWATFVAVVLGGTLHYALVDRPMIQSQEHSQLLTQELIEESEKNQRLLEERVDEALANTEAIKLSMDQMRAETELARATVDQMQDPARKEADALQLEKQRLDRINAVDELVDTLVPDLQVKFLPDVVWSERDVSFDFTVTNSGTRAFRLTPPTVSVTAASHEDAGFYSARPQPDQLSISSTCSGLVSPGDTIRCPMKLESTAALDGLSGFSYLAVFEAKTDLPPESETAKTVLQIYDEQYLDDRVWKSINFRGQVSR